jgi:TonB-dependent starch-binding outer membrane protein SusC
MIIKLKFAVIALLMICSQNVFSQSKTVQGVVTDNSGLPLPGVTVLEQGTKNTASTGFDGKYTLNNVASGSKLIFTFIGMNTKTVVFTGQASVNVMLVGATEELAKVVVVGYGSQKRANVTGAISTVNAKDIAAVPVANAAQALQGRAAGVNVVSGGVPGENPVIIIRGLGSLNSSNPLYVIDGVIVGNLSGISPNDIESVSVLKDASTAAIYGSQGSNGVVMVTTKKGVKGKGQLTFDSYTGINFVTKRYDLMNSEEYLKFAKDIGSTITRSAEYTKNDVDYQDEIFQEGVIKDYNLSYSSGGENGNQRFSGEYLNQEGAIINTGFERYNFRVNTNYNYGRFTFGNTMSILFSQQKPEREVGGRTVLENSIKNAPYLPVYNSKNNGGFQGTVVSLDGQDADNPVRFQTIGSAINKNIGIIGSLFGEYELASGLKFKTQVGLDYYNYNNSAFTPSFNDGLSDGGTGGETKSNFSKNTGSGKTIMITNSLNYKKTLAEKHNFEALVLAETFRATTESFGAASQNVVTDAIEQISPLSLSSYSGNDELKRVSFLGRLNYNYDEKYLLSVSIRRDASSAFGSNNRWGNFPSLSLGWNVAKENFLKNSAINNFKLRASWGVVGVDQIQKYAYSRTLDLGGIGYVINDVRTTGTSPNGLANQDLKWEETTMRNIGLDLGLFNNKFTTSIEVYSNQRKDILSYVPIPISLGSGSGINANYASVLSEGAELSFGFNDTSGDFTWSANANLGYAKNKITDLGLGVKFSDANGINKPEGNVSRNQPGESLLSFYGFKTDGIYHNQTEVNNTLWKLDAGGKLQTAVGVGDIRFKDLNGDGAITSDDRDFIGNPMPSLTYGLNLNAAYKGFDFNAFINGVYGNETYNVMKFDLEGMRQLFNGAKSVIGRSIVTGTGANQVVSNPEATLPKALGTNQNLAISDRYVEDGSFARLRNVTIGYTLPNKSFEKYISKLRLYVSGQNLYTITNYSGLDPELSGRGSNNAINNKQIPQIGIDRGVYPQPKTILLGMQLTF